MNRLCSCLATVLGILVSAPAHADQAPQHMDLWMKGTGGYAADRIPAITKTGSGTLLAFCEGRKDNGWSSAGMR